MQQWIKIEKQCYAKPEIGRIMTLTQSSRAEVFLACFKLWDWLDSNFAEGCLTEDEFRQIDEVVGLDGFAAAQVECGWIFHDGGVYYLRNYNRHNGRNAKRRAQAQRRVAQWRGRQAEDE